MEKHTGVYGVHTCKPSTREAEQDGGEFEVSQVSKQKQQTLKSKSVKEFSQIWDFLSFLRRYLPFCVLPKA